ncbi:ring finger domain protein [Zalerion maritima]|uniref:RING-type E3 ubiquitin transferase n=1 Tax=Zalerion maritima TaxID=339359 RepID=A0AAD5RVK2_9PEZI|nr:ring finger domain protein [Zalerion maritima]
MASSVVLWALAASVAAITTDPIDVLPDLVVDSAMRLSLNFHEVDVPVTDAVIVPLTPEAGLDLTDQERENFWAKGLFIAADATNYNNISSNEAVVYLPCEANTNTSNIDPNLMLSSLMEQTDITAIVLYNLNGNGCTLSENTDLDFTSLYSMNDRTQAKSALDLMFDGAVYATITGKTNITDSTDADPDSQDQGNNSAVAMSILYSITGLITLLFLIIIATGAIRAHRYPERYGPREGFGGRPRQSRAKGLARAVLDTLPIVKFGDSQQQGTLAKDPERDHELQSIPEDRELETNPNPQSLTMTPPAKQPKAENQTATDEAGPTEAPQPGTDSLATAAVGTSTSEHGDNSLGCSICTEDFRLGEDVRVLPCDHKFHPQCVDPWLINVSGTCPLCRLDLRPQGSDDEVASPTTEQNSMAPPLNSDDVASIGAQPVPQNRRMSRLFDLNVLRHAPQEERIEALRRYRTENEETQGRTSRGSSRSNDEERSRRAKLTDRLRVKLGILTTRRGRSPELAQTRGASSGAGT